MLQDAPFHHHYCRGFALPDRGASRVAISLPPDYAPCNRWAWHQSDPWEHLLQCETTRVQDSAIGEVLMPSKPIIANSLVPPWWFHLSDCGTSKSFSALLRTNIFLALLWTKIDRDMKWWCCTSWYRAIIWHAPSISSPNLPPHVYAHLHIKVNWRYKYLRNYSV